MKLFSISEKAERKAYLASRLPSTWPSHLHNKCNVPTCYFPNPPQGAHGTYNCQGNWRGHACKGTYNVSPSTARTIMQNHWKQVQREDQEKKWKVVEAAEMERRKVVQAQIDEEARMIAAEELAAKYAEKRKMKDTSTGSTTNDHQVSPYLARRSAQRRRPTDAKPTDLIAEQQHHHSHGSISATKYPSASNCPQHRHPETQTYNYQHGHGKSPSWF